MMLKKAIIRVQGGLGNQMFQYALGKTLMIQNGYNVQLDITGLNSQKSISKITRRKWDLVDFAITISPVRLEDTIISKYGRSILTRFPLLNKFKFIRLKHRGLTYVPEQQEFEFQDLTTLNDQFVYLDGYWQSPRYFQSIGKTLRSEFVIKHGSPDFFELHRKVVKTPYSVGIHVRRGDYVTNKKTMIHHGPCSLSYYQRAIKIIKQKIQNPHFFVFSDDIQWAKKNITLQDNVTFSENSKRTSAEDLLILSSCNHFILSNSSFSWWAEWLNSNPHKITVAPQIWLNAKPVRIDLQNNRWILIAK
jgi:hypothetical protein